MGMTIDKSITELEILKKNTFSYMPAYQAFTTAINIMRKYQQIVGIVSLNDEEFKQCGLKELKEILEVIADGNDNK